MGQCPSCSQKIDSNEFGLVICSNCGASLMVDIDGSVVDPIEQDQIHSQAESRDGDGPPSAAFSQGDASDDEDNQLMPAGLYADEDETNVLQTPIEEELDNKPMEDWGEEENSKVVTIGQKTRDYNGYVDEVGEPGGVVEGPVFEDSVEHVAPDSAPEEPQFADERTAVIDSHQVRQANGDFEDLTSHPYDGDYESVNSSPSVTNEDASVGDIERYGNSHSVSEGPLLYSITISGIDSQELREQVRQALSDRRLLFDVDGILRSVEDGQFSLQDISSLKTYVLVNQLMGLPLKFEWGQEANGNP